MKSFFLSFFSYLGSPAVTAELRSRIAELESRLKECEEERKKLLDSVLEKQGFRTLGPAPVLPEPRQIDTAFIESLRKQDEQRELEELRVMAEQDPEYAALYDEALIRYSALN